MQALVAKILTMPTAAKLLFALNVVALGFALVMQFGFDLHPCVLCLWQRAPYCLAAVASLVAWLWKPAQRHAVCWLGACAALYLVGTGLAVFHSGVELHWWTGTAGCAVQPLHGATAADLRESLLQTITPRCDEIAWTVLGLSMANLNILFSLALAFFATAAAAKSIQDK